MTTPPGKPLPKTDDPLTAPFWAGLAAHELRAQRCTRCGTHRLPAGPVCPSCLSTDSEWVAISDRGTLWSYNVYRRALAPAFAADVPYAIGVVELEHGLFLTSRLDAAPDDIRIGTTMAARYDAVNDDVTLLTWVPEENAHA
jgi:uncharacterized OB-fold protein